MDYYSLAYEGTTSSNEVVKFKSIEILGYTYSSELTGNKSGVYANAYRKPGVEMDSVLEENTLRTGAIKFFFKHSPGLEDKNTNERMQIDHYFAYIQWFKLPRPGIEDSQTYTGEAMSPYVDEFEDENFFCIVPVHRLHSASHLYRLGVGKIVVALTLPPKFQ